MHEGKGYISVILPTPTPWKSDPQNVGSWQIIGEMMD